MFHNSRWKATTLLPENCQHERLWQEPISLDNSHNFQQGDCWGPGTMRPQVERMVNTLALVCADIVNTCNAGFIVLRKYIIWQDRPCRRTRNGSTSQSFSIAVRMGQCCQYWPITSLILTVCCVYDCTSIGSSGIWYHGRIKRTLPCIFQCQCSGDVGFKRARLAGLAIYW